MQTTTVGAVHHAYDRLLGAIHDAEAARDRAQDILRARQRQRPASALDKLIDAAHLDLMEFARLHDRPQGDDTSRFPLRDDFCAHLDRVWAAYRAAQPGGTAATPDFARPLTILQEARYALKHHSAKWSEAVERCYFAPDPITHEDLASEIGVIRQTVSYRFKLGAAFVVAYCADHGFFAGDV